MKVCFLAFPLAGTVAGFGGLDDVNPCNPLDIQQQIWTDLADTPCFDETGEVQVNVQSGADISVGAVGTLKAPLDPVDSRYTDTCTDIGCMCAVNVHWHLGAEHRNEGTFDLNGADWMAENWVSKEHSDEHHRMLATDIEPGLFCPGYDKEDPAYTTEYDWVYCKNMNVGLTYEIHWPHSNLGKCGTEWQFQSHFMDGVLCYANENELDTATAVDAVFASGAAKIGVQGQVFTVVNDDAYDYPEWDMLNSWNYDLATNVAVYQGSTTGHNDGNVVCRGTGGAVTWQVDRGCHKVSAKAFDNLCKAMLEQSDDMSSDTYPHNSRVVVDPALATDVEMAEGIDFSTLE
jgi:hypothetical protein